MIWTRVQDMDLKDGDVGTDKQEVWRKQRGDLCMERQSSKFADKSKDDAEIFAIGCFAEI